MRVSAVLMRGEIALAEQMLEARKRYWLYAANDLSLASLEVALYRYF